MEIKVVGGKKWIKKKRKEKWKKSLIKSINLVTPPFLTDGNLNLISIALD